jgi:uncharacterized protein YmfQ (DUF2313 family)
MKLLIRLLNQKLGIIIVQILISLSLFTIAKPSLSQVYCRYGKTEIINPNGSRYQSCVLSTKFNKHGSIHEIGTSNSYNTFRIYQGRSGDAILESSLKRYYGSWRISGNLIIFQFPSGMKIYIPVEY